MAIDVNNFLHSLATWWAARASVSYGTGLAAQVWRNSVAAGATADPVSSLRIYGGGGAEYLVVPSIAVQAMTRGSSADATLARAWKLYEALLDGDRVVQAASITGWTVAGAADSTWRIIGVELVSRPGLIGVSDKGWHEAAMNVGVRFSR